MTEQQQNIYAGLMNLEDEIGTTKEMNVASDVEHAPKARLTLEDYMMGLDKLTGPEKEMLLNELKKTEGEKVAIFGRRDSIYRTPPKQGHKEREKTSSEE